MRGIKDKLSEYKYSGKVKYFLQNQDYELGQEDLATQLESAQMLRIDYSDIGDFDASSFFDQTNQSQDNGHNTTSSNSQSAQFIISRRPSKVNYIKRIFSIILSTLAFIAILAGAPFYLGYISFNASIGVTIACLVGIFIIPSLVSVIIEKKLKEKTNAAVRSWIDIIIFCILAHFISPVLFGVEFFNPTTAIILGSLAIILPLIHQLFLNKRAKNTDETQVVKVGKFRSWYAQKFQGVEQTIVNIGGKNYICTNNKKQKCLVLYQADYTAAEPTSLDNNQLPLDPLQGLEIKVTERDNSSKNQVSSIVGNGNNEGGTIDTSMYVTYFEKKSELDTAYKKSKVKFRLLFVLSILIKIVFHLLPALVLGLTAPGLVSLLPFAYSYLDYLICDWLFCAQSSDMMNAKKRVIGLVYSHGCMILFTVPLFFSTSILQMPLWMIACMGGLMLFHMVITGFMWNKQDTLVNDVNSAKKEITISDFSVNSQQDCVEQNQSNQSQVNGQMAGESQITFG
jgi:hypothetical protein